LGHHNDIAILKYLRS